MSAFKAGNVTKYDAGGSGDNYIEDGYIKSVEKVWIDSYTNTTNAITSADTILIGYIPKNKKLTEVVVFMPALTAGKTSAGTLCIGTGSTMLQTAANTYLGPLQADGYQTEAYNMSTAATLRLQASKFATVTPKRIGLYLKLIPANILATTTTAATIHSIIKYT